MPGVVGGAPGLGADVVLAEDPAGGEDQRVAPGRPLGGRHVDRRGELPLPRTNDPTCMVGVPVGAASVTGHCIEPSRVEPGERDAGERRCRGGDLVHDLARPRHTTSGSPSPWRSRRRPPTRPCRPARHDRAHPVDPALGVGERAVLLEERRAGQEHVREPGGLVEEQVVHDDELHRPQRRLDVLGVGVALRDVLALHVEALERPADRGVEHVGDAQARLGLDGHAPERLVDLAHLGLRHVPVAGQLVREGAHVARSLHVVLAAQRVDADALAAEVAGEHREVGHAHDHGRALAVLGDAEAVVDRRVAGGGVQPCGRAQLVGRGCRSPRPSPRGSARVGDELEVARRRPRSARARTPRRRAPR